MAVRRLALQIFVSSFTASRTFTRATQYRLRDFRGATFTYKRNSFRPLCTVKSMHEITKREMMEEEKDRPAAHTDEREKASEKVASKSISEEKPSIDTVTSKGSAALPQSPGGTIGPVPELQAGDCSTEVEKVGEVWGKEEGEAEGEGGGEGSSGTGGGEATLSTGEATSEAADLIPSLGSDGKESCPSAAQDGEACAADALCSDERYSYIRRGFTSEIFKVEIRNLPKYMGYTDLKKHLVKLGLKPVKIRKPQSSKQHSCFVNFPSEEDRETALKVLNGHVWKNRLLSVKEAAPAVDPLYKQKARRRRGDSVRGDDSCESSAKRPRVEKDSLLSLEQRLNKAVTPLLHIGYERQLASKGHQMRNVLQKAAYLIQKEDSHPGVEFAEQVKRNGGMMCQLKPTLESPLQRGYRNKVEFSIGVAADHKPVVGFRLGTYEDGNFTVVSVETCAHIPQKMKDMSKAFQEFFSLSPLPPYKFSDESGYWRQVAVRCYGSSESMAVVMIHPQQLSLEDLEQEKRRLIEFFSTGPGADSAPSSLYFQPFSRKTKDQTIPVLEHLLGQKHVHESLLGLTFRVSPDAFFQTNTLATEVLYTQVQELCNSSFSSSSATTSYPSSSSATSSSITTSSTSPSSSVTVSSTSPSSSVTVSDTSSSVTVSTTSTSSSSSVSNTSTSATSVTVSDTSSSSFASSPSFTASSSARSAQFPTIYDICCGTGTIGLHLAKALPARRVVGVEMNEQAVEDAKVNAQLNGILNAEFICGKAEDVLPKQLEELEPAAGEVIGVVDPPRGGLHPRVVQCIRRCSHIDKLIYVSCNPEGHSTLGNFVDLCRRPSLRIKGLPFRPVVAIPVDLFPHTRHCELVILFQRTECPPAHSN